MTIVTRRGFVASAAAAAFVGAACAAPELLPGKGGAVALAEGDAQLRTTNGVCTECPARCALSATVRGDLIVNARPSSGGTGGGSALCALGYAGMAAKGAAAIAAPVPSDAWDEGLSENSALLGQVEDGSCAAGEFGSALAAGVAEVLGCSAWRFDARNARAALVLSQGHASDRRPAFLQGLKEACDNGARLFVAASVLPDGAQYMGSWLAVRPGTELALLLSVAHRLVHNGTYAKDALGGAGIDISALAPVLAPCNLEWAEQVTGLGASQIDQVAETLWQGAPASFVDFGWECASGPGYANTQATARAAVLVNLLLGAWGQRGGALCVPAAGEASQDAGEFSPAVVAPGIVQGLVWEEPFDPCADGELACVGGVASSSAQAPSGDNPYMADIAKGYGFDNVWLCPQDAEARGIADGDVVVVEGTAVGSVVAPANVTARVRPGAIYVPAVQELQELVQAGVRVMKVGA